MPQFARPSVDTYNADGYTEQDGTATTIFEAIDEVAADDGDYIRSALAPTNDVYATKLTTIEDPLSSSGYTFRYRYGKDAAGGAQIDQTFQLRQGYVNESTLGTLIVQAVHTNVGVYPIAGSIALSGAEADSITNHDDLYMRTISNQV